MRITEIFTSLQGEGKFMGLLTTFIRTHGCKAGCVWCDSPYSFDGKFTEMSIEEIVTQAKNAGAKHICITGGEPMEQSEEVINLMNALLKEGVFSISLETNGFYNVELVPEKVHIIMDYKLPTSGAWTGIGADAANYCSNLKYTDEVKLVIGSYQDFYDALELVEDLSKHVPHENILFSSIYDLRDWMAEKIIEYKLPVKMGIQLHKILNCK